MPVHTYFLTLLLWLLIGLSDSSTQTLWRPGTPDERPYPQFAPVLSPDGSLFLYSEMGNSANIGRDNLADIWICQALNDDQWSRPINAGLPLNTDRPDQCLAINLEKNELFVLQERSPGEKVIAYAKLNARTWSVPQPMQIEPWDSTYRIHHGFISNDGQTLLLSIEYANAPVRKSDLFVAERASEDSWKNLQSLGNTINTPGQEYSAFLAADGLTLYFASDGHPGKGGLDLFYSSRSAGNWNNWSVPQNLGDSINTSLDEWGFYTSVKGEKAWWTVDDHTRSQILSALIPHEFKPKPVILVKGQVFLPQSLKPAANVTVSVNYFDQQRKTRVMRQGISNAQGRYQLLLPINTEMTVNAHNGQLFSPTYNLLKKGPAVTEREDNDEQLSQLLSENPGYQQTETEIERLQLTYNSNDVHIRNLNRQRQQFVSAILNHWEDTVALNLNKNSVAEAAFIKKLREDYLATQKQQNLLQFHDKDSEAKANKKGLNVAIPVTFDDFFRVIEVQQRWEILPATAQSLILQMLNEEIKKKDKEIKPSDRAIWRTQKEAILSNPTLLLLPEADLTKWQGVFAPCFEWQESFSRDIANFLLQKNQTELTSLIKNEVRNYLRTIIDMRLLIAQSLQIRQQIREKIDDQLRAERNFEYRPINKPTQVSDNTIDTLMVIADNELNRDIQLFDPMVEKTIILDNIVFLPNQAELDSSAYAEVQRLAAFLTDNPSLGVEIVAHTNNHCTYNFAAELTSRRAEKLAELLVAYQIPIERIRHRGMGKEQPIATNTQVSGRLANQRIEVTFILP